MIIVIDLSYFFFIDFVFIREGFLFFFVMVCIFGVIYFFFSFDYVDSQWDFFLFCILLKEKVFYYEWYSSLFYILCLGFCCL